MSAASSPADQPGDPISAEEGPCPVGTSTAFEQVARTAAREFVRGMFRTGRRRR